ncbi:hypothetical protein BJX70DRAFT_50955 [Aspergillus crustosus]
MSSTTPRLVASTITTTFVPPTNEASIVGYYSSGSQAATIACGSDYEFLVSSTHGICCAIASAGNCDFQQACTGTSMIAFGAGETMTCPNNEPCVETTLYQRQPSNGWSATMAWCMDADNPTSIYRSFVGTQLTLVPEDSFTTTTASDLDSTDTGTGTIPTRTTTRTTSNTSSSFTTSTSTDPSGGEGGSETVTPDPEGEESGSGTNVGAIAGGVVGGVAGLVLIVLAIWFVLRQKKRKQAELREIGTGYVAPEPK